VELHSLSPGERELAAVEAQRIDQPCLDALKTTLVALSITGWNLTDSNGVVLPRGTLDEALTSIGRLPQKVFDVLYERVVVLSPVPDDAPVGDIRFDTSGIPADDPILRVLDRYAADRLLRAGVAAVARQRRACRRLRPQTKAHAGGRPPRRPVGRRPRARRQRSRSPGRQDDPEHAERLTPPSRGAGGSRGLARSAARVSGAGPLLPRRCSAM
jgi:hypothetical protein